MKIIKEGKNMLSIKCDCGYKVEDKNSYTVEAKMWHHAIKDHLEMLKNMTVDQLERVLKSNDKQMKI